VDEDQLDTAPGEASMPGLKIGIDAVTAGLTLAEGIGGMRMYLAALIRAMRQQAPNAHLVLFENPHAQLTELHSQEGLGLFTCPGVPRNRLGRVLYQNAVYPHLMRRAGIDVLLATCNVLPAGTPVPTVVVIQSLQYFDHPAAFGALRRQYLRSALARSVERAAAVVCVSHTSKAMLVELTGVDAGKVHVVYHGLPPAYSRLRPVVTVKPAVPYILNVSSLHAYKNTLRLVEAYASLRRRYRIPHRLRIVGFEAQYTARDLTELAARLGAADSVDFLGPIPHEELPEHYSGADVFVYPSLYETFGLPPLEAMASSCPVVAADCSSIPEIVGDAAELVDPFDPESIAAGLLRVLSDRYRRADLIERGRERASAFTWERTASQTVDILRMSAGQADLSTVAS
jgi:glycosyltransferase involved in cell wall biosynthesis